MDYLDLEPAFVFDVGIGGQDIRLGEFRVAKADVSAIRTASSEEVNDLGFTVLSRAPAEKEDRAHFS